MFDLDNVSHNYVYDQRVCHDLDTWTYLQDQGHITLNVKSVSEPLLSTFMLDFMQLLTTTQG